MDLQPYAYSVLPSRTIRLLKLDGDSFRLEGTLHNVSIDDDLDFDALSYLWGPSDDPAHKFVCSGQRITVRKNLMAALLQFKERGFGRYIWIDAICIDQTNVEEKNMQIPLMAEIYKSAKKVISWLGHNGNIDMSLSKVLPDISEILGQIKDPIQDPWEQAPHLPDLTSPTWSSVRALLDNSYWERLWVLQELVLAQNLEIWVGNDTLSWNVLYSFIERVGHCRGMIRKIYAKSGKHPFGFSRITKINQLRMWLCDRLLAPTLLMQISGQSLCLNPQDKVFGIMGLLSSELRKMLVVDVTEDPVRSYIKIGSLAVNFNSRINQLYYVLRLASSWSKLQGLPSWCPNLSPDADRADALTGHIEDGYHAGTGLGDERLTAEASCVLSDGTLLHPAVIEVDVITEVIPWRAFNTGNEVRNKLRFRPNLASSWLEQCLSVSNSSLVSGSDDFMERFCRTLVANKVGNTYGRGRYGSEVVNDYTSWKAELEDMNQDNRVSSHMTIGAKKYSDSVFTAVGKRAFVATKGGRIGLGPRETRSGDLVCIFAGSPVPHILQSSSEKMGNWLTRHANTDDFRVEAADGQSYDLLNDSVKELVSRLHNIADDYVKCFVGEAYIDGLMSGEVLELLEKGLVKELPCIIK